MLFARVSPVLEVVFLQIKESLFLYLLALNLDPKLDLGLTTT